MRRLAVLLMIGGGLGALATAQPGLELIQPDAGVVLGMDWHLAARLIDPRLASKLTSLAAALGALNCQIQVSVDDPDLDSAIAFGGRVPSLSPEMESLSRTRYRRCQTAGPARPAAASIGEP